MIRVSILATMAFSLPAQQLTEGYTSAPAPLPAGSHSVLATANGTIYFDGTALWHDDGSSPAVQLLQLTYNAFGSFTIAIDGNTVLFGESSAGTLWKVPLTGGSPQQLATLALNYDAILLTASSALVSAKTGGFSSPDNDVYHLDLTTGQTQLVARVAGASGPLALAPNGDVVYATAPSAFPAPPGTVSILSIDRPLLDMTIGSGNLLGIADMTTVISGLDAAGDLAFDNDGDLLFVDWFHNRIGELNDATGTTPTLGPPLLDYNGSGLNGSVLQFQATGGNPAATFEPFQPTAATLLVHETDFATISQLRSIRSQRMSLLSSAGNMVPAGNFVLDTHSGPSNGIGLLLFSFGTLAGEAPVTIPGFEAQLFVDTGLFGSSIAVPLGFDANGDAALGITNPGISPTLDAIVQTVAFGASDTLGSSAPLALQIGP